MDIPTTHDILFLGSWYAPSSFVLAQHMLSHCSLTRFCCGSNICSDSFRTFFVSNGKRVYVRILYSWLSFCLQRNLLLVAFYVFTSSDALVVRHHYVLQLPWLLNMCSRGTLLVSLNSSIVFPYYFYHVPPIFLESESICFGATTSLRPTFSDNGKYVLSYNLHAMGGICKEGWLWDFLIKCSFEWLHNLTSDIYWWMLEHSSHCAVIVSDDDINNKESII